MQFLKRLAQAITIFTLWVASATPVLAEENPVSLKIKDHRFTPAELEIPAGEKRLLVIENQDPTAAEFESHSLHREKILPAKATTNIYIGPLKSGRYEFVDEFNDSTARGAVVVK